jgi:hypothetical protein
MNTVILKNNVPYRLPDLPPFARTGGSGRTVFLCSGAGWGNRRAAEALAERSGLPPDSVRSIEDFIPAVWIDRDFGRYQEICRRAPWLLRFVYSIPGYYGLKRRSVTAAELQATADRLDAWLRASGAAHLVLLNHRAAFWASEAKAAGRIRCGLWCAFTDYRVSPGWKHLGWEQIDGSFGPVSARELPARGRDRHREHPLAVSAAFAGGSGTDAADGSGRTGRSGGNADAAGRDRVLITGGGWGLGALAGSAVALADRVPELRIRVYCGSDQTLARRIDSLTRNYKGRVQTRTGSDMSAGIRWADAVVCRPGAMTLTESFAAGKKIFVLPGLPVIEEANARFAVRFFGAEPFTRRGFVRWHGGGSESRCPDANNT